MYPTQKRSNVSYMFRAWKAEVEAETGQSLYAVRMDNAGELRGLEAHYPRVKFEYTVPYTPEENGVAERLNRTIITVVRAMLIEARLPHQYWNLAAEAASYTRNRSPVAGIGWKTPEELYSGQKPDVKHLRIWGCKCYIHIPHQLRNKLDPVAWTGIFVGYEPTVRHYRVYNPRKPKIYTTRNIDFEENTPGGTLIQDVEDPESMDFEDPSGGDELLQTSLNQITPERPEPVIATEDSAPSRLEGEATDVPLSVVVEPEVPASIRPEHSHTDDRSQTPPIPDEIAPAPPTAPAEIMETRQWPTEANTRGPSEERILPDPNLRRSTRPRIPTKRYEAANQAAVVEPTTYEEAIKPGPNKIRWEAAIKEELDSLLSNGTWEEAELPKERTPISCRWIFKVKYTHTGHLDRFKARLVARGFSQRYGIDFEETFAPTLRYESLRLLLAVATRYDFEIEQMDVVSAYLSGTVQEELYMDPPKGLLIPPGQVCRLKKGLYGLKQAAAVWNKEISATLGHLSYTAITADRSVFHNPSTGIIIGLYVDDLIIVGPRKKDIADLKKALSAAYKMKDLGPARLVLGIRLTRNRKQRTLVIDQELYISKMLENFGMNSTRPVRTPMDDYISLKHIDKEDAPFDSKTYQRAVESLMYAMIGTRPDIAFAVSKLSQFNQNPSESNWRGVKRVFRYLGGTINYGIKYDADQGLIGYSDADWGGDTHERKSTTGGTFLLGGGAISWNSKKQTCVATSTMESEYIALCSAGKMGYWIKSWLLQTNQEKLLSDKPILIKGDNQSSLMFSKGLGNHSRSKHIDIQYHYVRELAESGLIQLEYVNTTEMVADMLTKPLTYEAFRNCRDGIGVQAMTDKATL